MTHTCEVFAEAGTCPHIESNFLDAIVVGAINPLVEAYHSIVEVLTDPPTQDEMTLA